ncbi:MAG: hypothetical protein ABIZ91_16315 [Gemmatimonadaceae bacterium]
MMRPGFVRLVTTALLSCAAVPLLAQGTLSTQGFGYPLGGLSARAAASGGALGEFDHLSSRNPAALSVWGRSGLYFEYDPELRSVKSPGGSERTTTARFGTIAAGFAVGRRAMIGVSSNTFLDRSWATRTRSGQRLGGDSVSFTETFTSRGAIGDTRIGLSYILGTRVVIGAGLHLFSGENRLNLLREFDDSVRYGTLRRDITLSYTGTGASAGIIFTPFRGLSLAGSLRQGGTMKLRVVDTLRTEAKVPNRFGFAARIDAFPGLALMASADRTEWSKMNGLGSTNANAQDAWEYGAGAEFTGQRTPGGGWTYSVGYRQRDLPFLAGGAVVREKFLSTGTSAPLAGQRATLDLTLQRATRSAAVAASERAWLVGVGFTVRP